MEHTIFHCNKWESYRSKVKREIEHKINPDNAINILENDKRKWKIVANHVRKIMKNKEIERRLWQSRLEIIMVNTVIEQR